MTEAAHTLLRYQISTNDTDAEAHVEDLPIQEYDRFAQCSVTKRCAKALWASLLATPAVESRPSPFGRHVAYREDMPYVAVVVHGSLHCYAFDGARGAAEQRIPTIGSEVYCVCCKPCGLGYIGVGTASGVVLLRPKWGGDDSEMPWALERLDSHAPFAVDAIDFHPNGRHVVAAGPKIAGFYVYDVMTGAAKQCRQAFERVYDLQYSPCGGFIMTVSDCRWVHIWSTSTWSVIKCYGSKEAHVCSTAWSLPKGVTTHVFMSFSDSPYLAHCCIDREAQVVYKILQSVSAYHLSAAHEGRLVNCAKCLCWEKTGQRLAVLLDHPHPKVGSVALFRTGQHSLEFIEYLDLHLPFDLTESFHASMTHRRCEGKNSVEFAVYIRGIVACFTVRLDREGNKQ